MRIISSAICVGLLFSSVSSARAESEKPYRDTGMYASPEVLAETGVKTYKIRHWPHDPRTIVSGESENGAKLFEFDWQEFVGERADTVAIAFNLTDEDGTRYSGFQSAWQQDTEGGKTVIVSSSVGNDWDEVTLHYDANGNYVSHSNLSESASLNARPPFKYANYRTNRNQSFQPAFNTLPPDALARGLMLAGFWKKVTRGFKNAIKKIGHVLTDLSHAHWARYVLLGVFVAVYAVTAFECAAAVAASAGLATPVVIIPCTKALGALTAVGVSWWSTLESGANRRQEADAILRQNTLQCGPRCFGSPVATPPPGREPVPPEGV